MASKYHINPETGNPGVCKAEQQCRFGEATHYATEMEAREAFEAQMEEALSKLDTADVLEGMPLKEMDAALLATTLFKEAQKNNLDASYIASSIDIASILHARQMRFNRAGFPKTPYIEHPLRNAIRLMRLGVNDENIIVAAVLHDTIEDGADVFVEKYLQREPGTEEENRRKLSLFIKQRYGAETLATVEAVTNPLAEENDPSLSKNQNYRKHVVEQIEKSPTAYLVKLSDFVDNAGGLYHQDSPGNEKLVKKLSNKYMPLAQEFLRLAPASKHLLSEEGYSKLLYDVNKIEERLNSLIAKHGVIE